MLLLILTIPTVVFARPVEIFLGSIPAGTPYRYAPYQNVEVIEDFYPTDIAYYARAVVSMWTESDGSWTTGKQREETIYSVLGYYMCSACGSHRKMVTENFVINSQNVNLFLSKKQNFIPMYTISVVRDANLIGIDTRKIVSVKILWIPSNDKAAGISDRPTHSRY